MIDTTRVSANSMPVHSRNFRPVVDREEAFARAYRSQLSPSDFDCLLSLIRQSMIDVVIDKGSRGVALVPQPEVETFLDAVFSALVDD